MSKRKKQEIDVYIEKVNAKEIEGEYDTRDLCAKHFERELMKKCQAARKFEIHQLLFNGKPTGYGRCSDQTVSTMIERAFSEMTSHFTKEGNRIHAETLLDIHHKKQASTEFIKALQATANAHKIETGI